MWTTLDKAIFELLDEYQAYAPDGLLKFDIWKPIAANLNRRGLVSPSEGKRWSHKTVATYYRRHLKEKDPRLMQPLTT